MTIVTQPPGYIRSLSEIAEQHNGTTIVAYNRCSCRTGAGPGKRKLYQKTIALLESIKAAVPDQQVVDTIQGVEKGQLSQPRPHLHKAIEVARSSNGILVASDLSRFIRSESYDRRHNADCVPTKEEFDELAALAKGVVLATVADPGMTETERHAVATCRTGKAGRPRAIDDDIAAEIFDLLGPLVVDQNGHWRWLYNSLTSVARQIGLSPSVIQRLVDSPSPDGRTWRQVAIDKATKLGLYDRAIDGTPLPDHGERIAPESRRGQFGSKRGRPSKVAIEEREGEDLLRRLEERDALVDELEQRKTRTKRIH